MKRGRKPLPEGQKRQKTNLTTLPLLKNDAERFAFKNNISLSRLTEIAWQQLMENPPEVLA